jgi:hypothetical protein
LNDLQGRWPLDNFRQDFFFRSELDLLPLIHRQNEIKAANRAGTVRDHDDNAFSLFYAKNCACERLIALGIEV